MNNNNIPFSQNIYNSYPFQYSQNLNCIFYLMPDNQIFLPNYNFYQIFSLPYYQNLQLLPNVTNNQNEEYREYAYNYNNMNSLINNFNLNNAIPSQVNNQLNLEPSIPAPLPQDNHFLNKKRSNSTLFESQSNNYSSEINTKEDRVQIKEVPKIADQINLENKETYKELKEANIIKSNNESKEANINNDNDKKVKNEVEQSGQENNINTVPSKEKDKGKEFQKIKEKKRKNNYAELLQDTFLEHIGEKNKKIIHEEVQQPKLKGKENIKINDMKNENKNKTTKLLKSRNILKSLKPINKISKINQEDKGKTEAIKRKNSHHQKKKQHKITIKNNNDILAGLQKENCNESKESNPKLTKVIFHGNDYETTKSAIDFMKYNFDFSIEEQYKTKKLITDYVKQHINIIKLNENIYENNNSNNQNLETIEQKWSRKKFNGDDKELKKAISIIRDTFPGRKTDINEEICLNLLKNNEYNIEKFLDSNFDK